MASSGSERNRFSRSRRTCRTGPVDHSPKTVTRWTARSSPAKGDRDRPRWLGCNPKAAPRPRSHRPEGKHERRRKAPRGCPPRRTVSPEGARCRLAASSAPKGWHCNSSCATPKDRLPVGEPVDSPVMNPRKGPHPASLRTLRRRRHPKVRPRRPLAARPRRSIASNRSVLLPRERYQEASATLRRGGARGSGLIPSKLGGTGLGPDRHRLHQTAGTEVPCATRRQHGRCGSTEGAVVAAQHFTPRRCAPHTTPKCLCPSRPKPTQGAPAEAGARSSQDRRSGPQTPTGFEPGG